jgi:phosphomethylpyrimidine synthase
MKTQLEEASIGVITEAMRVAAEHEHTEPEKVAKDIAAGLAVLTLNPGHKNCRPTVVGRNYSTKVNANIGRSPGMSDICEELKKLEAVVSAGADFVMDLSVGEGSEEIRKEMLAKSPLPLGTVPIYEAFWKIGSDVANLETSHLLKAIEDQAEQGVDFMTIHAGLLRSHLEMSARRKMGIVSRGGSLMAEWMARNDCENPFFSNWDEIMSICRAHDVTLSLGDGLRPGCLADASDEAQFAELDVLGDLVLRCRENGVQVMVEGPGHIPYHQIQMNVERQIEKCHGAPFYVLGPIVTDIAAGYDHIASAIGGTAAAFYGAALLCYVTPAEHLGLPNLEDVREGIIAHRIAAHAADVAKGLEWVRDRDDAMSDARNDLNWDKQFELALDGDKAREKYESMKVEGEDDDHCSMCGKDFCSVRTTRRLREELAKNEQNK